MPETCRVSWQNKFWIFYASTWLFCTRLITMHGHLNIKHLPGLNQTLSGALVRGSPLNSHRCGELSVPQSGTQWVGRPVRPTSFHSRTISDTRSTVTTASPPDTCQHYMSANAYFNNPDLSVNFHLNKKYTFLFMSLFQSAHAFDEPGHLSM
jgi:hypothetical protein